MQETKLKQLIEIICDNPDLTSLERQRIINRLLLELQQLPGLLKSSHPYYLEALNRTWEWVSQNICNFQQRSHLSFRESLVKWINGYLAWRIKDLYLTEQRQYNKKEPLFLLDQLSETGFETPSLSGLDAYLEEVRKQNIQEMFERFEHYVEEDPEMLLKNCHPRNLPDFNCQLLAKKLLFKDPPERLSQIHREYQNLGVTIPYQTISSHWKRKCLPLLQKIIKEKRLSDKN